MTINFRKTIIIGLITLISGIANSQIIDNYGIKIGGGLANQSWKYKNSMFSNISGWKGEIPGFVGQFFVEKIIGSHLSFRPEIGYIQKGFKQKVTMISEDYSTKKIVDNKTVFHDLSLDLSLKIIPFQTKIKSYFLLGIRGDYAFDCKSIVLDYQGKNHKLDTDFFNDFNKFTMGGIFGIGAIYNDFLLVEAEYNPSFTKNYNGSTLAIKDRYFSLTLGVNLNKLVKQKD